MRNESSILICLSVLLVNYACSTKNIVVNNRPKIDKKVEIKPINTPEITSSETKQEDKKINQPIKNNTDILPSSTPTPSVIPDSSSSGSVNGGSFSGYSSNTNSARPSYTIRGLVDFSKQVKSNITVALIDDTNRTQVSGITDNTGRFVLDYDSSFIPSSGIIYSIEAQKRLSGSGSFVITERSYVRWNGSSWESMTTPEIVINSKTTAMILIGKSVTNKENLMGKLDISKGSGTSLLIDISQNTLENVDSLVQSVIGQGRDPFEMIKSRGMAFFIDKSIELNTLSSTNACIGCDFTGVDLANVDMSNKDLSKSVFNGMNLATINFTGSNLSKVDLSHSNLSNSDLSKVNSMQKVDCTNTYMSGVNLTGINMSSSKLSNAYLVNANLSNADLSNADLSNAILTNANLSNANLKGANLSGVDLSTVNKTRTQF